MMDRQLGMYYVHEATVHTIQMIVIVTMASVFTFNKITVFVIVRYCVKYNAMPFIYNGKRFSQIHIIIALICPLSCIFSYQFANTCNNVCVKRDVEPILKTLEHRTLYRAMGVLVVMNMYLVLAMTVGAVRQKGPIDPQKGSFDHQKRSIDLQTGYCELYTIESHLVCRGVEVLTSAEFFGWHIEELVLSSNPLGDRISGEALTGLQDTLEGLYMDDCGINTLPDGLLRGMWKLTTLDLQENNIDQIPAG